MREKIAIGGQEKTQLNVGRNIFLLQIPGKDLPWKSVLRLEVL